MPSPSLNADETLRLIEGWLLAAPDLSFKRVRNDARNLNVSVTARQFSEVKRRLGITGAPPRSTPARPPQPRGRAMNGSDVVAKTPLMNFIVEFLRNKPEATFQEVKSAGEAASFQVAPINYGNARRMLGMAAKTRTRQSRARRLRQAGDGANVAAVVAGPRARRGRRRKLDFDNLSNLVGELRDVVAERDRLLAALEQIAAIIRNV